MPKHKVIYSCTNPRCKWVSSIRNMTVTHMKDNPICAVYLYHCIYCKKYYGFNQQGLENHYRRNKMCLDMNAHYQDPLNMDPKNSVRKATKLSVYSNNNGNEMRTDAFQFTSDNEVDLSDSDESLLFLRTITQNKDSRFSERDLISRTAVSVQHNIAVERYNLQSNLDALSLHSQSSSESSSVDLNVDMDTDLITSPTNEIESSQIYNSNAFNRSLTCTESCVNNESIPQHGSFKTKNQLLSDFQQNLLITKEQIALVDLFFLLEKSGAPITTFDRVVEWGQTHANILATRQTMKRTAFMKSLKETVYPKFQGKHNFLLQPSVSRLQLPSGKSTTMTVNDFEDNVLELISSSNPLFTPENLLINPENPQEFLKRSDEYFDDVDSGEWMRRAQRNINARGPKHILLPFCLFIDEICIDKYGKLKIEAVLCCCLWFKRQCRKQASFWFNLGYIEKFLGLYKDKGNDTAGKIKQMDWHAMMAHILNPSTFMGILGVQKLDGMEVDLSIGPHHHNDMILHPEIAYIICDCEGRDLFVGRHKGHSLQMPGLCGDCDCATLDASNVEMSCTIRTKASYVNKNPEELRKESFHHIRNAFFHSTWEIPHIISLDLVLQKCYIYLSWGLACSYMKCSKYCCHQVFLLKLMNMLSPHHIWPGIKVIPHIQTSMFLQKVCQRSVC